ncbi:MAG: adenylosuccinate lyase [Gammaproteobacteria bacterium]
MKLDQFTAISPIDGRYLSKLTELQPIFSEFGLMRYRLLVEIRWFQELAKHKQIPEISSFNASENNFLEKIINNFSIQDAKRIKTIENKINHDVKSVEYFIKERIATNKKLSKFSEFVHFGCTSEDINNLAYALMVKDALQVCVLPQLNAIMHELKKIARKYAKLSMLSRTHGQPATPTTLGKEIANFAARLDRQCQQLKTLKIVGKFNGAVGNYNAHLIAYPKIKWQKFSAKFVSSLGLEINNYTTQIEPHDWIAELNHVCVRINNILIDFCRDIWMYISLNYFSQKISVKEVGSSTMPHKVNPIDFENAEGNLGVANALLQHFANKLPISRLQRDLSDSTVMRNLGAALAHSLLAYKSLLTGIGKLEVNKKNIKDDLANHVDILAEALQTIMRRYGVAKPYEKLKKLTRGKQIDQAELLIFIDTLDIPQAAKHQLKHLRPEDYTGLAAELARDV